MTVPECRPLQARSEGPDQTRKPEAVKPKLHRSQVAGVGSKLPGHILAILGAYGLGRGLRFSEFRRVRVYRLEPQGSGLAGQEPSSIHELPRVHS